MGKKRFNQVFDFAGCRDIRSFAGRICCILLSLYALYYSFFGGIDGFRLRITHLFIAVLCVLFCYPLALTSSSQNRELEQASEEAGVKLNSDSDTKAKSKKPVRDAIAKCLDVILIVGTICAFGFLLIRFDWVSTRMSYVAPVDPIVIVLGVLVVLLVLECTRRTIGAILTCVALAFIAYWFIGPMLPGMLRHAGYSLKMFVETNFLTSDGIFGTSLAASAQYIVLFVIFGALLEQAGLGKLMMDFCLGVFGKRQGGPALVAVFGSAFVGTFSGSAAANVLTTGSISIPLMKSIGFEADLAGGVEAASSTGGMIMPPVMGAIAFLMSEYMGVEYIQICIWALLPAILYFLSIGVQVYLHAQGIKGLKILEDKDIPDWKKTAGSYWTSLLPLLVLIALLVMGASVQRAVSRAIIVAFILCMIRKGTRLNFKSSFDLLARAAKSSLSIVCACACAGIIVGVVSVTGLGNRLNITLLTLAGSSVFLALLLTAVSAIILGMGMPAAASYIVQYATVIPTLINLLEQSGFAHATIVAHMFCLYFCNLSAITPPVALAAYAGASVAGGNPIKTGFQACRLAITAFIVPFLFVYSPELLLIGETADVVLAAITSVIGVCGVAIGLEGYALTRINPIFRVLALLGGIFMLIPGLSTDIIGMALLVVVMAYSCMQKRKSTARLQRHNS